MRKTRLPILFVASLLFAHLAAAQDPAPLPVGVLLPNIKTSLEDGFFSLAEQQARGILRSSANENQKHEATLLLAHALWGQKRYSEMLTLLKNNPTAPGFAYWRARANFELKRNEAALKILSETDLTESPYAPAALRLKGRIEILTEKPAKAESTFLRFASNFPNHPDRTANQFDLAETYTLERKIPEAIAVYDALSREKNSRVAQRAQLKLAHLLYTQGAEENLTPARETLTKLATNTTTRLAYRIDAFLDLSSLEEQAGQRPAAIQALRQAIALSPDARQRVPLKISLAQILLRDGDTVGALKLLEECRVEAPNEAIAAQLQLEKAGILLQAEKYKEANEAYQIYLDVADDPTGLARAYFGKGLALWKLQRFSESATAFDKAEKKLTSPEKQAEALFKAGDAWLQAGKPGEAEKRYRTFSSRFPNSPLLPNALYQLGLSQAQTGQHAAAAATFKTLETDYAQSPFAEKAALRSADLLLATAQWEAALEKYTQIGETYTNSATAALSLQQRGMLLYRLKHYESAQKAFEKVVANYPDSEHAPQASYMRGFCLYGLGKVTEAVKTCENFIEKYPHSEWTPKVLFWLAEQYYNKGKYTEAEPLFIRIATDFKTDSLASHALYWAGRSEAAQANYVKALERYGEVAKDYPQSDVLPEVRFAQGDALSELGEFARAILAFEEIIKNYPENHLVNAAWGRKGDCQFSLASDDPARYTEAIKSYQAILDRPSAPVELKLQAEYKVGRCLEKTNVPDKAFSRYMNVVYTFVNGEEKVAHSVRNVMWFTRAAFGAAALKEREKAWVEAVQVYKRVIEAEVPASSEAAKRIEKIEKDNWLLLQQAEEK
jgi:TolA-binding protein